MCGWRAESTAAMRSKNGTIVEKLSSGSKRRVTAPIAPPNAEKHAISEIERQWPFSSGRNAYAPATEAGRRPTELETLAMMGGYPSANRTGKVIRVPAPATALMMPARIPAARMTVSSRTLTT